MQQNDRYVCACVAQGGEQMAHGKASARSGHSGRRIIGRCLDKSWKEEKQRTKKKSNNPTLKGGEKSDFQVGGMRRSLVNLLNIMRFSFPE